MTGWQVLGWVLILDAGIVFTGFAVSLGRIFWQSANTRDTSHSIFRGRNDQ